jgi:prepilin-type N-terminal cleavage/methylation domain-containing protein
MPVTGSRPRPGLGLIELIAVIAILGLVAGMVGSTIVSQQQFHRRAAAVLGARQGVRDAMEVLSTDIRGASLEDTVRVMADSALELFAGIGVSVACGSLSGNSITLAAESPTANTLTSFLLNPDTGDIALIYRRDSVDGDPGRWERHRIAAVTTRLGDRDCLTGGAAREGFVLTVQSPIERAVEPGTPVRFARRGRFSLYRSSDGKWYLGYRRCNAIGVSACGAIQPISGPYRRYDADKARTGFLFEYYDSSDALLTSTASPLAIARVDISARAESDGPRHGSSDGALPEFASASIAIRNR